MHRAAGGVTSAPVTPRGLLRRPPPPHPNSALQGAPPPRDFHRALWDGVGPSRVSIMSISTCANYQASTRGDRSRVGGRRPWWSSRCVCPALAPAAQRSGLRPGSPGAKEPGAAETTLRPAPSCAGCCFPGRRTHKVDAAQIRRACAASPPQARVSLRDTRVTARVPAHRCTRNLITLLQLQINSNLVLTLKMNPILC